MALVFKNEKDRMLFTELHIILIMIYADLASYAKDTYGVDLVITQTVTTKEEDVKLGRVSDAHREKRAIDVRTKDLDIKIVNDLVNYINNKWAYKKYHYQSRSGMTRLAYYHTGTAEHIHLAIHKKYAYNINIAGL
jgi:hypothetical protein